MKSWATDNLPAKVVENDWYAAVEHEACAFCGHKSELPIAIGKGPYSGNICKACWFNSIDARTIIYNANRS
jgi:hypothetical protein